MIRILVNDGIHIAGQRLLEEAGFEVDVNKIAQEDLMGKLNEYDAICVRSATKVRQDLIEACPRLKVIGRGGVGLDNIDVDFARSKGLHVLNTPAASSQSVAELAIAHMLTLSRSMHLANRQMPGSGHTEFKGLKKAYSKGSELRGKTLGVIGCGRIGKATIRMALGMGMKVSVVDPFIENASVEVEVADQSLTVNFNTVPLSEMLSIADYITLHIPSGDKPAIGKAEFDQMKDGVIIVNAARGGTIDEDALIDALNSGRVQAAGLDVFVGEPSPRADLLGHPSISLTPHIGASTGEAQRNIGVELAQKIIDALK